MRQLYTYCSTCQLDIGGTTYCKKCNRYACKKHGCEHIKEQSK